MAKRNNAFIPHSILNKIEKMTDEEAGKLFRAVLIHSSTGEDAVFEDRLLQATYEDAAGADDKAAEAYQSVCDKRSESGKAGAAKRWQSIAKDSKPKQSMASIANKDRDKNNDISADADISARARGEQPQREYIRFYEENVGAAIPSIVKEAETFIEDDGMEDAVIVMALKESVDAGAKNWKYAKAVLSSWLEKGIKTPDKAKAALTEFKNRVRGKPKDTAERSYTAEDKEKRKKAALADMEELANGI
jgi:DnaD/phage-associated family protein